MAYSPYVRLLVEKSMLRFDGVVPEKRAQGLYLNGEGKFEKMAPPSSVTKPETELEALRMISFRFDSQTEQRAEEQKLTVTTSESEQEPESRLIEVVARLVSKHTKLPRKMRRKRRFLGRSPLANELLVVNGSSGSRDEEREIIKETGRYDMEKLLPTRKNR